MHFQWQIELESGQKGYHKLSVDADPLENFSVLWLSILKCIVYTKGTCISRDEYAI